MNRRHADPIELARTSTLVAAWKRRLSELAAGDDTAHEHWYAHLSTIARPVPRPACEVCDDIGVIIMDCTVFARCAGRHCDHRDRSRDVNWTHSYARACLCERGLVFRVSFEKASHPEYFRPRPTGTKKTYGFTRPTEARS